MNSSLAVAAVIFVLVLGLGAGYLGGTVNSVTTTVTNISTQTEASSTTQTSTLTSATTVVSTSTITGAVQPKSIVVNLVVIADYGGAGYDAFILPSSINATGEVLGTNTTAPGRNNNNITVLAGTTVKFVITNIDNMMFNFTGKASQAFSVYNDTSVGQVAVQYNKGADFASIKPGHTFTSPQLGINIPISALTVTTFSYTFTKPGTYLFYCATPCGPGMTTPGYMQGYIIVT